MREDLYMPEGGPPARRAARWKLAVGAVTVAVASVIAVPVAAASVHTQKAATPAIAAAVVKPAAHASNWVPIPTWPHWGWPLDGPAQVGRSPVLAWPHWGGPETVAAVWHSPSSLWPHWGDPH